jgi:hypothetical protein
LKAVSHTGNLQLLDRQSAATFLADWATYRDSWAKSLGTECWRVLTNCIALVREVFGIAEAFGSEDRLHGANTYDASVSVMP